MLQDQSRRAEVRFGDRESLHSRAVVQRQVRFPRVPRKKSRSARRLRAPNSQHAQTIRDSLIETAPILDLGGAVDGKVVAIFLDWIRLVQRFLSSLAFT